MTERYPSGFACHISLGVNDEPLLGLAFMDEEQVSEVVLTEVETEAVLSILTEASKRAAILREMITMFPEQRDNILANLMFRWTGEINGPGT